MSEKIRRKELKRPDGVLTALRNAYQWAEENIKTLVVIGGLIFGAAVVWVTINHFQTEAKIKAFAAYLKAEKSLEQKKQALTKDKKGAPANLLTALEAELTELGKIAGEHGSTHAAFMSQMKLGELYESENKSDLAIQSYTGALKHADTMLFKVIAHYNLGHAYEAQGATNKEAYQQAIAQYEKITEFNKTRLLFWEFGDRPNIFWLTSAYFGMGRCYETFNKDKARESYLQVVDQFPNTPFSDRAESFLVLLNE